MLEPKEISSTKSRLDILKALNEAGASLNVELSDGRKMHLSRVAIYQQNCDESIKEYLKSPSTHLNDVECKNAKNSKLRK